MERPRGSERHRGRSSPEGELGKSLSRDEARGIVLATLRALKCTPAEMFRAVLAADAESDWVWNAKHKTDDTWGLYQQNPKWWGTREQILDPVYATTSFVLGRPGTPGLRKITLTDDPVLDCWRIQQWGAPTIHPDRDMQAFLAHPGTQNYTRRLPNIPALIAMGYGRTPYGKNYGG